MSRLAKLATLSWADRLLLARAGLWLGVMRAGVLMFPLRRVATLAGLRVAQNNASAPAPTSMAEAERIGWAVRKAAAHTPWQSACLIQALAGAAMLRKRHIASTLYIGVAKDAARDALLAHAWLSCGETVLTGEEESRRFAVLSSFVSS